MAKIVQFQIVDGGRVCWLDADGILWRNRITDEWIVDKFDPVTGIWHKAKKES